MNLSPIVYKISLFVIFIASFYRFAFAEVNNSANGLFNRLLDWHKKTASDVIPEDQYKDLLKVRDEIIENLSELCEKEPNILIARLRHDTELMQGVGGGEEALGWLVAYEILPIAEKLGTKLSPHLIVVLQDKNESWLMKDAVAGLLGRIKAVDSIPVLAQIAVLKNSHRSLRIQSLVAIESIGKADTKTIKLLLSLLSSSDEMIKRSTISLMGSVRAKEAVPALRQILAKEQGPVAMDAMHALADIEGSGAITWLKNCLESSDRHIRETAFNCLGDINEPSAKEILCEKLLDPDPEIANQAAIYLRPGLNPDGRKAVLDAIEKRRQIGLKPAPEMVRRLGWGEYSKTGWDLLLEYLDAKEPEYRAAATRALGSSPEYKEAIVVLQNRLKIEDDESVREVILQALRNYNAIPETYNQKKKQ